MSSEAFGHVLRELMHVQPSRVGLLTESQAFP